MLKQRNNANPELQYWLEVEYSAFGLPDVVGDEPATRACVSGRQSRVTESVE